MSANRQSLQEWHAAGGGVPVRFKGKEHIWHNHVKRYARGGDVTEDQTFTSPAAPKKPIGIDAFGDSTTWGYVNGKQVPQNMINTAQSLFGDRVKINNYGVNSTTLGDLLGSSSFNDALTNNNPVVILNYGMNEAYRGEDPETFRANLMNAVSQLQGAGKKVILQTPNNTSSTEGWQGNVGNYANVISEVANQTNSTLDDKYNTPITYSEYDTYHPSEEGYGVLGQHLYSTIDSVLNPTTQVAGTAPTAVATTPNTTAAAPMTIESLYQDVLGRAPDAEGLAYWQQQFGNEVDPNEKSIFTGTAQNLIDQDPNTYAALAPKLTPNTATASVPTGALPEANSGTSYTDVNQQYNLPPVQYNAPPIEPINDNVNLGGLSNSFRQTTPPKFEASNLEEQPAYQMFAKGGSVNMAGGGDPRKRVLYPKLSTQAIEESEGFQPDVPSDLSRAYARRMADKAEYERNIKDQKLTPTQRGVAGLEAAGMLGSAMFEGVQQLPKLLDSQEAYEQAVGKGMYQPRFQPEKATEYVGNVGDFLEQLETKYKMPQVLPELIGMAPLAEAAKRQAGKAVKQGAVTAASRMDAGPTAGSMAAQRGIVKMPGGNWLDNSVEKGLDPLKRTVLNDTGVDNLRARQGDMVADSYLEERPKTAALNNWVDRNLTNYVKKQMATPDDPVRKLAEQDITHFPIAEDPSWWERKGGAAREDMGGTQMAKSDLAKQWENRSDAMIQRDTAQEHQDMMHLAPGMYSEKDEWIKKLPPETNLYKATGDYTPFNARDLGFDHIMDVLKQDVAEGRIRPEQLSKVSMEQAVRRTYEYDQEMAKKMRETAIKSTEGMPLHKEYPEGYKWIELAMKDELPEGWTKQGNAFVSPTGERSLHHPNFVKLNEALDYEGDTMGHCVGGYCPDVAAGRSRIYSLRDAKGEPHVTIETEPLRGSELGRYAADLPEGEDVIAMKNPPHRIVQIKGKGNRAPKEEYLPFVQDFVKGGNWRDVGDFRNTGLIRKSDLIDKFSPDELDAVGSGEYLTKAEVDDLLLKALRPPEEGMKAGGRVNRKHFHEPHLSVGGDLAKIAAKSAKAAKPAAKVVARDIELNIPQKGSKLVQIPVNMIEHGESVMPGGKMTWPGAKEKIVDYATRKTPLPPIDVVSNESGAPWMVADGSHRLEAAKLRGEKTISAYVSPHDKEGLEIASKLENPTEKAAEKVSAPAVIPNLLKKSTASEIGREERARRQAAGAAEEARVAAAKQMPMPIGYVTHTEKSPNPHVGYRYEADQPVGITPSPTIDVGALERSHKGASMLALPWDATNRNVRVSSVSGEDLAHPIWSHGGTPYSSDEEHLLENIGGASGRLIANRIVGREENARKENKLLGGTGEILHAVNTMGKGGENYALPSSEFAFDVINRRVNNGDLTLKQADDLSNEIRNYVDPDTKKQPFKNWAGFISRDGAAQMYTGEGLNGPTGDLRKLIAKNIIYKKKNQELLNFNAEDFVNSITHDPLKGVGRGYIGSNLLSNVETSPMKLSKTADFPWLNPYDTNFSATHLGQLEDLVPIQAVMSRKINPIEQEFLAKQAAKVNGKPYTPESLQGSAISALEKRKDNVAQFMDDQFFQDLSDYMEALKKPLEKKKGGLAQAKKPKKVARHGNTVPN